MSKRINVLLSDQTVKVLDKLARKGDRSRFISQAVMHYVKTQSSANLRDRLKAGALANAGLDLEIAVEWFPVEDEAWQKVEKQELAQGARGGEKSTSRRSTRRSATK